MRTTIPGLWILLCALGAYGQGTGVIPVTSSFSRAYAIVPMIGKGTYDDPVRPLFAPAPTASQTAGRTAVGADGKLPERTGIIAFSSVTTDDGRLAIIEVVAVNRQGLREILESTVPGVQVFEFGRVSTAEMETVFKRVRRDFDFSRFQTKVR